MKLMRKMSVVEKQIGITTLVYCSVHGYNAERKARYQSFRFSVMSREHVSSNAAYIRCTTSPFRNGINFYHSFSGSSVWISDRPDATTTTHEIAAWSKARPEHCRVHSGVVTMKVTHFGFLVSLLFLHFNMPYSPDFIETFTSRIHSQDN